MKKMFGAEVDVVPSHGGRFEVSLDGKLLFSKKAMGRFPEEGEIAGLVRAHRG